MVAKKKRPTRRKTAKAQANNFMSGFLVLAGLVGVAAAGWYVSLSPVSSNKPQRTASVPLTVPVPVNAPNNTPESIERIIVPTPKVAANLTAPQSLTQQAATNVPRPQVPVGRVNNEPTIDSIISASITSSNPAPQKVNVAKKTVAPKQDKSLPFKERLQPNNGAQPIFVKQRTIIYAIADTAGPKLTVVERGQELRSYEQQGSWHRVTVPRTGIIGWARDEGLTAPTKAGIDRNKTASISKR